MASPDQDERSMLSHTLRETLDSVVAPHVRDTVIRDALRLSGMHQVPEEAPALQAFSQGPLRLAIATALGTDLARSLTEEIVRALRPALDSQRPPPPEPALLSNPPTVRSRRESTVPATPRVTVWPATPRVSVAPATPRVAEPPTPVDPWPPGLGSHIRTNAAWAAYDAPPSGMTPGRSAAPSAMAEPLVLVATDDETLFKTLADWFHGRARTSRLASATELVRHLDGPGSRRCLVILDGKAPSVKPAALIVLLEEHPRVDVVLCRAAAAIEQVVLASPAATDRWLVYREPASLDHVAAECLRLVS